MIRVPEKWKDFCLFVCLMVSEDTVYHGGEGMVVEVVQSVAPGALSSNSSYQANQKAEKTQARLAQLSVSTSQAPQPLK